MTEIEVTRLAKTTAWSLIGAGVDTPQKAREILDAIEELAKQIPDFGVEPREFRKMIENELELTGGRTPLG